MDRKAKLETISLKAEVVGKLYPYAGVLRVNIDAKGRDVWGRYCSVWKKAKQIHDQRLSLRELLKAVVSMSASMANCYVGRAKEFRRAQ